MSLKSVSRIAVLVFATTVTSPAGSQQPPVAPTPRQSQSATPKRRTAADSWRSKYSAGAAAAGFAAAHTRANPSAGPGHPVTWATRAGRSERDRTTVCAGGSRTFNRGAVARDFFSRRRHGFS